MIRLVRFEVLEGCPLDKYQINQIKGNIEYKLNVINEALERGEDRFFSGFIQSYETELVGMKLVCATIGLAVRTEFD